MKDGIIAILVTEKMLQHFIHKVRNGFITPSPRVLVCAQQSTQVERKPSANPPSVLVPKSS